MLVKLTIAVEDAVTAVEDESKAVTIIDDAPRTAKTILEEADLNKDGVLDLTEASEYLVFDGKLHIEVKIDLVSRKTQNNVYGNTRIKSKNVNTLSRVFFIKLLLVDFAQIFWRQKIAKLCFRFEFEFDAKILKKKLCTKC